MKFQVLQHAPITGNRIPRTNASNVRAKRLEANKAVQPCRMRNPFRYFNLSPKIISLTLMTYVRYPLTLRQVEDLLHERGIDICHETVRFWWNRFGPMFAVEIRKRRVPNHSHFRWRWHLDEVFVRINGEIHYLWRAVDHEEEVLEFFVADDRDCRAAVAFLER